MKILVVSLLRLGDVIMTTPVLRGLKRKYPGAKIHLLLNRQNEGLVPLMPFVDKFHFFERGTIQKSLKDPGRSLFEGFDRTRELVTELNREGFDELINLTHNRLSGNISALVESKSKAGLVLLPDGRALFGSAWFRYLNEKGLDQGSEIFHFSDIFFYGSGLAGNRRHFSLVETVAGKEELESIRPGLGEGSIVLQCVTSDSKKNWGLRRFQDCISILHRLKAGCRFVIPAAPTEAELIEPMVEELRSSGVAIDLAVLGLEGVYSLIKRASLVVSLDTAIKHMACAAGTKVLELSLGSSDYRRTGAYQEGALILQPCTQCAPCAHSCNCPHSEHSCARDLSPEIVALSAKSLLERDFETLRLVAHEYRGETDVLEVTFGATGDWSAVTLAEEFNIGPVARWLDRSSWRILLNRQLDQRIVPYGTESLNIQRLLSKEFPERQAREWKPHLDRLESELLTTEKKLSELLMGLSIVVRKYDRPEIWDSFMDQVLSVSENAGTGVIEKKYATGLTKLFENDGGASFLRVRRVKELLSEMHRRSLIELKLVKSLKTGFAEVER